MDSSEMLSCSLVDATNQLDFTVSDISLSTIDSEDNVHYNTPVELTEAALPDIDEKLEQLNISVEHVNEEGKEETIEQEKLEDKENGQDDDVQKTLDKCEEKMGSDNKGDLKEEIDKETTEKIAEADNENKRVINTENVTDKKKKRKKKSTSENDSKDIKGDRNLGNSDKKNDDRSNEDKEKCKKKDTGGGDGGGLMCEEKTEESGLDKDSGDENTDDFKLNKIKKCRVKLPMKGERFRVKFVDNFNVPHKLLLKNTDKVAKRKLNMLLAKKQLEPLNSMPMSRLKEKCHVLIKFRKPAKLIRAQVKWIQSEDKIEVQDIDSGTLYLVTKNDIFVLDDELIANIYPRVFICNLSEFDGKNIYWNPMIRDLYISTLRSGQISIEIRTFHHTVQSYDVHLKLYLDEKKFINLNEWLANSFIPYLVYLKTSVPSPVAQQVAKYPTEIFFPYVKLLKE